jgi:hypothetical protein
MLYYWISFNISVYFYVISPLSFSTENNMDHHNFGNLLQCLVYEPRHHGTKIMEFIVDSSKQTKAPWNHEIQGTVKPSNSEPWNQAILVL